MTRYEVAAHAIQSAIAYLMNTPRYKAAEPKHLRVGIDISKAEQQGLATLLMDKGVFTFDEYEEAMTLALEVEADRYAAEARKLGGLSNNVNFR